MEVPGPGDQNLEEEEQQEWREVRTVERQIDGGQVERLTHSISRRSSHIRSRTSRRLSMGSPMRVQRRGRGERTPSSSPPGRAFHQSGGDSPPLRSPPGKVKRRGVAPGEEPRLPSSQSSGTFTSSVESDTGPEEGGAVNVETGARRRLLPAGRAMGQITSGRRRSHLSSPPDRDVTPPQIVQPESTARGRARGRAGGKPGQAGVDQSAVEEGQRRKNQRRLRYRHGRPSGQPLRT